MQFLIALAVKVQLAVGRDVIQVVVVVRRSHQLRVSEHPQPLAHLPIREIHARARSKHSRVCPTTPAEFLTQSFVGTSHPVGVESDVHGGVSPQFEP